MTIEEMIQRYYNDAEGSANAFFMTGLVQMLLDERPRMKAALDAADRYVAFPDSVSRQRLKKALEAARRGGKAGM